MRGSGDLIVDHEGAFQQALRVDPTDEVARSVYADWLEERGDARGELLRILIALPEEGLERRASRERRLAELLPQIDRQWVEKFLSLADRFYLGDAGVVWDELLSAGDEVRHLPLYQQALTISRETMLRINRNLGRIITRLDQIGYHFQNRKRAHALPPADVVSRLDRIEQKLNGPLPLSLRAFWEVVGSVDFRQSEEQNIHDWIAPYDSEIQLLGDDDPLYVEPFETLEGWLLQWESFEEIPMVEGRVQFQISPDCYHKAGVSGGDNYHVVLPDFAVDFRIVGDVSPGPGGEGDGDLFVEYLRRSVLGGGFRGRVSEDGSQWLPSRAILRSVVGDLESF